MKLTRLFDLLGKDDAVRIINKLIGEDGGPGSGNWGHKGRPGLVGGSGPGGGRQYRGGRSDIGYYNSKSDWLNGLTGEKQGSASKMLASAKGKIPPTSEMTPEGYIMKNWPIDARASFVDLVGEARSWKDRGNSLSINNLTGDEYWGLFYIGSALEKKYGSEDKPIFTDNEVFNNNFDSYFGLMRPEEKEFYLDMKAKACGLPTSGKKLTDYSKGFQKEIGILQEAEPPKTDEENKNWVDFLTNDEKESIQKDLGKLFGTSIYGFDNSPDMNNFERKMCAETYDRSFENNAEEQISALNEYLIKKDKYVNANFFKSMATMPEYYAGGDDGIGRLGRYSSHAMLSALKAANTGKELTIESHGDVMETNFMMDKTIPQDIKASYLTLKAIALGMPDNIVGEGVHAYSCRRKLERFAADINEEKRKKTIEEKKTQTLKEYNEKKKQNNVVIKGDKFSEDIDSMRTDTGSYNHEELKAIGKRVIQEIESVIKNNNAKIAELSAKCKEFDEQEKEEIEKLYETGSTYNEREAVREKYRKLRYPYWKERNELQEATPFVDLLKRIREIGPSDPSAMKTHMPGRSTSKRFVEQAYKDYPRDWVDRSINKSTLTIRTVSRGFYRDWDDTLAISGGYDKGCYETATHELGHRFEYTVPGIVDKEREFFESRTKNDKWEKLRDLTGNKGYKADEKAKKDKFINPYIGRDNGGDSFEVVSMGFEYAIHNPAAIMRDPEYAQLIFGLLAVG